MGKKSKENLLTTLLIDTPSGIEEEEILRLNGSHGMALHRSFPESENTEEGNVLQLNTEINLTAFYKLKLTDRQKSLLLDVLNYQIVNFGLNFNMMMCLWFIYLDLLGNAKSSLEVLDNRLRLSLTVSECIIKTLRDFQICLDPGQVIQLPQNVKEILRSGLMSKRTFGSRFVSWRPERFLGVKAVPVDIQFLERRQNSQPYSSYCKGYGESHPSAHCHKTKFSSELDGNNIEQEELTKEWKLLNQFSDRYHHLSDVLFAKISSLFWRRT